MSEALAGVVVGGVIAGAVAIWTQILASRFQSAAAMEDRRHDDRTWLRNQRLEAHHMFLNRVNRLLDTVRALKDAPDTAAKDAHMKSVAEALANTVEAFNRVELVATARTYDLAVALLVAADAEHLGKPEQFDTAMVGIAQASRNYRDAVKAELKA